ncbi:MAG TPA: hypothetical protein VJZ71_13895 [Phycisphaerae bacterium]|nr:hypothetical protein [Phycisphaerae bacterium]
MKTARRQELRTNELSQQIDQIGDYVKQNAAMLTIIVAAAAILTAGGFWFVKGRQSRVMDGWAMLNDAEILKDMRGAVEQYRTLAEENRTSALTLAAWLRIGELAMSKVANPDVAAAAADPNWSETAANAYTRILEDFPNDVSAVGLARISLGVLAENKKDFDNARKSYQAILDDSRLADSPYAVQAKYRLDGLARWSQPVVFAPAPIVTTAPDPLMTPPSVMTLPLLPTTAPTSGPAVGGVPITPLPSNPPVATTQPAG